MTDERLTIGELGAYTNNSPNKEGIKKLVDKVNTPAVDAYTKTETDALLDEKQDVLTAGTGIAISEQNVISVSGGGDWVLRTPNNDWSDLFELDDGRIKTKKDILFIYGTANDGLFSNMYPKGFEYNNQTDFCIGTQITVRTDIAPMFTRSSFVLKSTQITTSGLDIKRVSVTPVINDGVLDYGKTNTTITSDSIKGNIAIYTKN